MWFKKLYCMSVGVMKCHSLTRGLLIMTIPGADTVRAFVFINEASER